MEPLMLSEVDRLASNQQALLQVMPEIVLLISGKGGIEYMNPSALSFFGDLRSRKKGSQAQKEQIQAQLLGILKTLLKDETVTDSIQGYVKESSFECSVAPFYGYKGDDLFWLILTESPSKPGGQKRTKKQGVGLQTDDTMVGQSRIMRDLHHVITRVAGSDATVLITGESGTGKELVAELIRQTSKRNDRPYLTINCNTINDLLLESDLFGYEKGSFTGAHSRKKGIFETVSGGTIFLDEIGDISPRMQAALLRVLQNGEIIRVGGSNPIQVDARIIAATNKDLVKAVHEGNFRLDLFFRLNIININVPPLRERKEDIADLISHFVRKYSKTFERKVKFTSDMIIDKLYSYDWPGNIRELENVIQRAVLMCEDGEITNDDLVFAMPDSRNERDSLMTDINKFNGTPLKSIVAQVEKEIIVQKLELHQGNVALAADSLQLCKTALYEKMKRHGISAKKVRRNITS